MTAAALKFTIPSGIRNELELVVGKTVAGLYNDILSKPVAPIIMTLR